MSEVTRIAVLQMASGIDPAANAATVVAALERAAGEGAAMLFTPEMTGLLDRNRQRAAAHIVAEAANPVLGAVQKACAQHAVWCALGSLAVLREVGRWANRSLLVDPAGAVVARYDKIHMFDVDLATGESWRESNAYAPGEAVVTADTPVGRLGLTVCYDIRFPALYEELGQQSLTAHEAKLKAAQEASAAGPSAPAVRFTKPIDDMKTDELGDALKGVVF